MRSINVQMKQRVIRLFLLGSSYDEIVIETGVSKGTVVNIIEDFRKGKMRLPCSMSEYVDFLRKTAVDLKKNQLNLSKLDVYIRIHNKIKQMGVNESEVEEWLSVSQSISETGVSNSSFVNCALELARLESREKVKYEESIEKYKAKLESLGSLNKEVEKANSELHRLKGETKKSEGVLRSVKERTEELRRIHGEEKAKLDKYLEQSGMSWDMVNLAKAVLDEKLGGSGLTNEAVNEIEKQITAAGSLRTYVESLDRKKKRLENQVRDLSSQVGEYQEQVGSSALKIHSINRNLHSKQQELASIEEQTANCIENLYVSKLILDFLFATDGLGAMDLNNLVEMMIGLRQKRLGVEPKVVTDPNGKIICRCQVPHITTAFENYKFDADHVREAFAYYLSNLTKDKLVTKVKYEMVLRDQEIKTGFARLEGIAKGVEMVLKNRS